MSEAPSHNSWWISVAGGAFAGGVLGVLGAAPFWVLVVSVIAIGVIRISRPEPSQWLLRWTEDRLLVAEDRRRAPIALIVGIFLVPCLMLYSGIAGMNTPNDLWNPSALLYTSVGAVLVWAFAHYGGNGERAARWWPYWLVLAVLVGSFLLVGGPFRARWAYCESRLTAAVQAGEEVTLANSGRFCWHTTPERTVDGQRRLYLSGGANNDSGAGLAYSPDRAIEAAPGMRLLRRLGNGWYYFETGSAVRDFWYDG